MQSLRYEVKVETTSPIRRQLTVSVAPETIKDYMESSFAKLQKTASLKGFRKGKVPLAVLKQYYLGDVKSDVLKRVVSESFWKAVQDNKILAVGSPEIDSLVGTELEGQALSYVAKVEVFPEVKLGDVSKIKIKKEDPAVTAEDIEKSLQNIQESHAEIQSWGDEAGHDSPVKVGDQVEISFSGTVEGQTNESLQGSHQMLKIGSKRFMEEFEAGIVGMKKGETKKVTVTFSTEFPDEFVAGKQAEFEITLHELKKVTLPTLDDEFAKRFKLETVEDLKKKVRETLEEDRKKEAQGKTKESLIRGLLENHSFEVPKSLVETELQFLVKEVIQHLQRQGFTEKMSRTELTRMTPNLNKQAEDRVRAFLLFDRIAEDNKLQPTDADLEGEFEVMAKNVGTDVAQIKGFYGQNEEALRRIRHRLKEDRVVDYLLTKVKVEG